MIVVTYVLYTRFGTVKVGSRTKSDYLNAEGQTPLHILETTKEKIPKTDFPSLDAIFISFSTENKNDPFLVMGC